MFTYCSISCLNHLKACRNPTVKGATYDFEHWNIVRPLAWNGNEFVMRIENKKNGEVATHASSVELDTDYSKI